MWIFNFRPPNKTVYFFFDFQKIQLIFMWFFKIKKNHLFSMLQDGKVDFINFNTILIYSFKLL